MKWWTSNEKRTVLAVRPVDEHTVQASGRDRSWSSAPSSWTGKPSWRSMLGLRGCRPVVGPRIEPSMGWLRRSLRHLPKVAPPGRLMVRDRPSGEAADEAEVEGFTRPRPRNRAGGRHSATLSGPEAAKLPESAGSARCAAMERDPRPMES